MHNWLPWKRGVLDKTVSRVDTRSMTFDPEWLGLGLGEQLGTVPRIQDTVSTKPPSTELRGFHVPID